jgi:hypothetical protein
MYPVMLQELSLVEDYLPQTAFAETIAGKADHLRNGFDGESGSFRTKTLHWIRLRGPDGLETDGQQDYAESHSGRQ